MEILLKMKIKIKVINKKWMLNNLKLLYNNRSWKRNQNLIQNHKSWMLTKFTKLFNPLLPYTTHKFRNRLLNGLKRLPSLLQLTLQNITPSLCKPQLVNQRRLCPTGKEWLINANKNEGKLHSKFYSKMSKIFMKQPTSKYTMKMEHFYNQLQWNI